MPIEELKLKNRKLQQEIDNEYRNRYLKDNRKYLKFILRQLARLTGYLHLKVSDIPTRGVYYEEFKKEIRNYCNNN